MSAIKEEAAHDADRLRRATWTRGIPVDPVAIARTAGLRVLDADLGAQTMGALVKQSGQDPTIMLNQDDSPNRKRFTCAHEIGHFVRRAEETTEYSTVDLRSDLSTTGEDQEEIYANEFAACLLMPEESLMRLYRLGFTDLEMAIRFMVSREAMQYRMRNFDMVVG